MLVWCGMLFFLGIAAFLDSLFTFGEIFRRINSVLFMLVSLGVLVRVSTKKRMRITEGYLERIATLEKQIKELTSKAEKKAEVMPKAEVMR
jgi:hypothetical protein